MRPIPQRMSEHPRLDTAAIEKALPDKLTRRQKEELLNWCRDGGGLYCSLVDQGINTRYSKARRRVFVRELEDVARFLRTTTRALKGMSDEALGFVAACGGYVAIQRIEAAKQTAYEAITEVVVTIRMMEDAPALESGPPPDFAAVAVGLELAEAWDRIVGPGLYTRDDTQHGPASRLFREVIREASGDRAYDGASDWFKHVCPMFNSRRKDKADA